MNRALEILPVVRDLMNRYHALRKRLRVATQINWFSSVNDVNGQLDRLVHEGFIQHTGWDHLTQLSRYVRAIDLRLDKLGTALLRDRQRMDEMSELYRAWQQRDEHLRETGRRDERIDEMRWMFEELRVSLFAQELGTAYPVSVKRVTKRWQELGL